VETTLPRILYSDFADTPDSASLIREFNAKFADDRRDHHPDYRSVAISAMCSLVALGPEVSTPVMFLAGFSQYDLSFDGVLEKALASCFVPKARIQGLARSIIAVCERYGLDVSLYCGGKPCETTRSGHLLQIFVKRSRVDEIAYAAKPYGEVDEDRQPLSSWLDADSNTNFGQARILAHPKHFLNRDTVRVNMASADPVFHVQRPRFQEELIKLMSAAFAEPELRKSAAMKIAGGHVPDWWADAKAATPSGELLLGTRRGDRGGAPCRMQ
jgi:hypothetical protein